MTNKKLKSPVLKLVTWNVRTKCLGLSDDFLKIDDSRKTAIIDHELLQLNMDIAGLQETRPPEDRCLREGNYTFSWQGQEPHEYQLYGVGFTAGNSLSQAVGTPSERKPRIFSLRLKTSSVSTTILSIYAATLCSLAEAKDVFYENLEANIRQTTAE